MKFLSKLNAKANTAMVEKEKSANNVVKGYYSALAAVGAVAAATSPLFAIGDIFDKVSDSLKSVYKEIITISSVVAITFIAICLIIRMVSKNQRSVEEATSWAKRIALTWLILNLLSYVLAYGEELTEGGQMDW